MDGGLFILIVFIVLSIMDAVARGQRRKQQQGKGPVGEEPDVAWEIEDPPAEEPGRRRLETSAGTEVDLPARPEGTRTVRSPRGESAERVPQPPRRPARSMIPPELWEEITALAGGKAEQDTEPQADVGLPDSAEMERAGFEWGTREASPGGTGQPEGAIPSSTSTGRGATGRRSAEGGGGALVRRKGMEVGLPEGASLDEHGHVLLPPAEAADHGVSRGPRFSDVLGAGDRESLRKAFIIKEVLGPPVSERREGE